MSDLHFSVSISAIIDASTKIGDGFINRNVPIITTYNNYCPLNFFSLLKINPFQMRCIGVYKVCTFALLDER